MVVVVVVDVVLVEDVVLGDELVVLGDEDVPSDVLVVDDEVLDEVASAALVEVVDGVEPPCPAVAAATATPAPAPATRSTSAMSHVRGVLTRSPS